MFVRSTHWELAECEIDSFEFSKLTCQHFRVTFDLEFETWNSDSAGCRNCQLAILTATRIHEADSEESKSEWLCDVQRFRFLIKLAVEYWFLHFLYNWFLCFGGKPSLFDKLERHARFGGISRVASSVEWHRQTAIALVITDAGHGQGRQTAE